MEKVQITTKGISRFLKSYTEETTRPSNRIHGYNIKRKKI